MIWHSPTELAHYLTVNRPPGTRLTLSWPFCLCADPFILATSPLKTVLRRTAITAVLWLLRRCKQSFVDCYSGRSSIYLHRSNGHKQRDVLTHSSREKAVNNLLVSVTTDLVGVSQHSHLKISLYHTTTYTTGHLIQTHSPGVTTWLSQSSSNHNWKLLQQYLFQTSSSWHFKFLTVEAWTRMANNKKIQTKSRINGRKNKREITTAAPMQYRHRKKSKYWDDSVMLTSVVDKFRRLICNSG